MRPTRTSRLLAVAVAIALVGWVALRLWASSGHELPTLPWTAPAVMLLLAVTVLALGWPVRRWTNGERDRPLDPLRAARTVVLAKAAQYSGALLTGWYAAQALALLPTVDVAVRRSMLVRAGVSLVTAVLVWVFGWVVERWCRVDLGDDDDPPGGVAA
jgi:hypothetical protein